MSNAGLDTAVKACDGCHGHPDDMVGWESIEHNSPDLPTCPPCAVLWDQAVVLGELRKQKAMDHAAWVKADEDNNEAFWETLKTGVPYRRSDR